jgi:hypothetical protein
MTLNLCGRARLDWSARTHIVFIVAFERSASRAAKSILLSLTWVPNYIWIWLKGWEEKVYQFFFNTNKKLFIPPYSCCWPANGSCWRRLLSCLSLRTCRESFVNIYNFLTYSIIITSDEFNKLAQTIDIEWSPLEAIHKLNHIIYENIIEMAF